LDSFDRHEAVPDEGAHHRQDALDPVRSIDPLDDYGQVEREQFLGGRVDAAARAEAGDPPEDGRAGTALPPQQLEDGQLERATAGRLIALAEVSPHPLRRSLNLHLIPL